MPETPGCRLDGWDPGTLEGRITGAGVEAEAQEMRLMVTIMVTTLTTARADPMAGIKCTPCKLGGAGVGVGVNNITSLTMGTARWTCLTQPASCRPQAVVHRRRIKSMSNPLQVSF